MNSENVSIPTGSVYWNASPNSNSEIIKDIWMQQTTQPGVIETRKSKPATYQDFITCPSPVIGLSSASSSVGLSNGSPKEDLDSLTQSPLDGPNSSGYSSGGQLQSPVGFPNLNSNPIHVEGTEKTNKSALVSPIKKLPFSPVHMQAVHQHALQNQASSAKIYASSDCDMVGQGLQTSIHLTFQFPTPPSQHGPMNTETSPGYIHIPREQFLTPSPESPGQWSNSSEMKTNIETEHLHIEQDDYIKQETFYV